MPPSQSDSEDELRRAEEMLADLQAGAAERGKYLQPGQCPSCAAYRLDGRPPIIHEPGCQWEGDVDQLAYYER